MEEGEIVSGVFILRLPVEFLALDASPDKKEVVKTLKNMLSEIAEKGSGALILPDIVNENGEQMFRLEIVK